MRLGFRSRVVKKYKISPGRAGCRQATTQPSTSAPAGRLVRGGGKTRVALAAAAAARHQETLIGRREIVQPLAGRFVVDHRADGHLEIDRVAFGACAIAALSMPAALRLVLGVKTELDERVSMLGGNHEDVAAAAAIAAAGASARNIFLAAKG